MRNPKLLLGAIVLGALFTSPNEAQACCFCNVSPEARNIEARLGQDIVDAIRKINDHTTQEVTDARDQIIENYIKETRKQRNALASAIMQGSRSTRDTLIALETNRINRDMEPPPDGCTTSGLGQSLLKADRSKGMVARSEEALLMTKILANSRASASTVYSNIAKKSRNFQNKGNFYSLWMGQSDSFSSMPSATLSGAQLEDARAYVEDLFSGIRLPAGGSAQGDGQGLVARAMIGVPLTAFTDQISRVAPVDFLGKEIQNGDLKRFLQTESGKTLMNSNGGMSFQGLLQADVERRYSDPTWYTSVSGMSSPVSIGKESLFLNATLLKVAHEQLKVLNKIEMQIAANTLVTWQKAGGGSGMSDAEIGKALGKAFP